jgi:hypothetical protein
MYNKIFTKILDSSIWLEPDATRIVWLTCIAAMDEDGFCAFASVANLAHRANVPVKAAQRAVETLEGPDPNSSDPDHDGRRLERVVGGWLVLNAQKYRELVTRTVHRERLRQRVERHRERKRNALVTHGNADGQNANASVTQSEAYTEAYSEAEAYSKTTATSAAVAAAVAASKPRPRTYGRITLHRWQLESLIAALGPHADGFDLDAWVLDLSALADRRQLVLDRQTLWPWVQAELRAECQRRGLAVASSETSPQLGKQSTRLLTAIQNIARTEGEA